MSDLLGGRGKKPDQILEGESFDERLQRSPVQDGLYVTNLSPDFPAAAVTVATANRLRLYLLDYLPRAVSLKTVAIAVETEVVGSSAIVGIYLLDPTKLEFILVPGSQVTIPTDSTGRITASLNTDSILQKDMLYAIAIACTSATVELSGALPASNGSYAVPVFYLASITSLPKSIFAASMTKSQEVVLAVSYISKLGAKFL